MKKFILLFSGTALAIIGIFIGANYIKGTVIEVESKVIESGEVESSLVCSGKAEYLNNTEVVSESDYIIDNINVQLGDRVEKDTKLISVSEAIANSLPRNVSANDIASALPSVNDAASIEEIYKNYLSSNDKNNMLSDNVSFIRTGRKLDVSSPVKGIVTSINVKNQDSCYKGKPLVVISDTDKYRIHLSVNESKISDLKIGQKACVTGTGFKGYEYSGTVTEISNAAQQILNATGSETVVDVYVDVEAQGCEIKPGLTAKCKITTSVDEGVNIVPYESVKADKDGKEYVYKYSLGRAVKTYISTAREYDDGFEVTEGLSQGDILILNPDGLTNYCRVKLANKSGEDL